MPDAPASEARGLKGTAGVDPVVAAGLRRFAGRRGEQILAAVAAGQMLAPIAAKAYKRVRSRDTYSIAVGGMDDVYPVLHEWVLEQMPERDRKAMIASSETEGPYDPVPHDRERDAPRIRLRYDGNREQRITLDGHRVEVHVAREALPYQSANIPDNWRRYTEQIIFRTQSTAGRDAIVAKLNKLAAEAAGADQAPALYLPSRWGAEWTRRGDLPARNLDSTVLKAGQLERLVDDLDRFFKAEDAYNRLSQPWHRGYLFHGEPGTGKTSVARALANHFEMPTYYLPLADIKGDTNLMQFVAAIKPRSVLLLEDVDAYHATTSRDEQGEGVSIAAMLNALDGVWTPHGLVTIMTTNHREALDDALLRAGRVDVDEKFTVLDEDQASRLAGYLGEVGEGFDANQYVGESPATLIEAVRRVWGGVPANAY